MRILLPLLALLCFRDAFASNVASLSYSSTNVTTSAYVTFVSSTPINTSRIIDCDTSGAVIKIAVGAAASEVDYFVAPVSGCIIIPINPILPSGVRISLKAISGTASTGYNAMSFLQ